MQLVGYFRDVSPAVHFESEVVRRIARAALRLIVISTTVEIWCCLDY